MNRPPREIRRIRHEARRRALSVAQVRDLTPRMRRITLAGPELAGFTSPGFDDHVKLFFDGAMRDYTPRHDAGAQLLHIDFALHGPGPASDWARSASTGQTLAVGGPRGSFMIPLDYDWHLLVGDESALPAIGRRLAELPAGARAVVIAEVEDAAEEQPFATGADVRVQWVHRKGRPAGDSALLLAALAASDLAGGEYFAWAAAESNVARAIRRHLVEERAAPRGAVKAAGYWKLGAEAFHDRIED